MRRLIIPIALATSMLAAGSLAGASADPGSSSDVTTGLRSAGHTTADQTTDPKTGGQATDWTSVAPENAVRTDDAGDGEAEPLPAIAGALRLITVIGHGTTLTAALDDAATTAQQIAHHEDLSLGDIQAITQQADVPPVPPVATPETTTTTTPDTTPSTGLPATAGETVTVAYAID